MALLAATAAAGLQACNRQSSTSTPSFQDFDESMSGICDDVNIAEDSTESDTFLHFIWLKFDGPDI